MELLGVPPRAPAKGGGPLWKPPSGAHPPNGCFPGVLRGSPKVAGKRGFAPSETRSVCYCGTSPFRTLASLAASMLPPETMQATLPVPALPARAAATEAGPAPSDTGVLDQVRMVKTPSEVAALGAAAQVTERAIRDAFEGATSGDTEKTVADNMSAQLMGSRADIMNFLFLGTGIRSFEWHAIPGSNPLTRGDMVHTDIGGSFNGYWSDVARTVVVGRPTAKQRELHNKLYGIHVKTVESIRPGMRASDLYRLCGEAYEDAGLPFSMAHIGHGHRHRPSRTPDAQPVRRPGAPARYHPMHRAGPLRARYRGLPHRRPGPGHQGRRQGPDGHAELGRSRS